MQDGVLPPIVNHSQQLVHSHKNGKPKECINITLGHIFPSGGSSLTQKSGGFSFTMNLY